MHDLRRQALLESGKTVSRKARSRTSTPASSKPASPATSRATSRNRANSRGGSDDEGEGDNSDGTSFRFVGCHKHPSSPREICAESIATNSSCSVGSIDEILNGDNFEGIHDGWRAVLLERIDEILARKGSTNQGREKAYKTYIHLLSAQYAEEEIAGKEHELVTAFLRSIREEKSEQEAILAANALAITIITSPLETIYEAASTPLKRSITASSSPSVKTAVLHTLGTCTFYSGAADDEITSVMDYYLDIVSTDGATIDALDSPTPVTAALESYALLATLIDDMSATSSDAIDILADQLSSTSPAVQIAAGESIALLYEKSVKPWDPTEDPPLSTYPATSIITDPDFTADPSSPGPKYLRLYPAYTHTGTLLHTLTELSRTHTHHTSKAAQKALRTTFADITTSLTHPTRPGPRFSNAIDQETGKRFGSRLTVKVQKEGVVRIDRWWKLVRLQGLKRVLGGGFVGHMEANSVVFETLPVLVTREG